MTEYVYSNDEVTFNYESPEEAAIDAFGDNDEGQTTIWRGKKKAVDVTRFVPDMREHLQGMAAESEFSEWIDIWPNSTHKQDQELQDAVEAVVKAWVKKHSLEPTFYSVVDVEPIQAEMQEDGVIVVNEKMEG